ncbi:MAG: hypothetical protein PHE58_06255 [Candidatus Omnitrophica bacterium]|nr:hypothetical protein [Candidatus Omnitrophota bacterium]
MSKKLIFALALTLAVSFCAAAYAEVQNVKVGGDITAVGLSRYRYNLTKEGSDTSNHSSHGDIWATITRVKLDAELTDNVSATVRMLNERAWGTLNEDSANTDIDLDLANITIKEFFYEPLTVVVGRQPIMLGDGLLVADPWTNQVGSSASAFPEGFRDLSARRAFDGIVTVWDYNPLTAIVAFVKGSDSDAVRHSDDVNVWAANVKYDTGVLKTVPELTWVNYDARKGQINNYSVRATTVPLDDLALKGEYVFQTRQDLASDDNGHKSAYALLLGANYTLSQVQWTPALGVDYTRLGKNWFKMFEAITPADIMNVLLPNTNAQVFGVTGSIKPKEDLTLKLRYAYARLVSKVDDSTFRMWPDVSTGTTYYNMTDKKTLGNEVDMHVMYDYTEDVQLGLKLGLFQPGNAFDKDNRFYATQAVGTMKVTF